MPMMRASLLQQSMHRHKNGNCVVVGQTAQVSLKCSSQLATSRGGITLYLKDAYEYARKAAVAVTQVPSIIVK